MLRPTNIPVHGVVTELFDEPAVYDTIVQNRRLENETGKLVTALYQYAVDLDDFRGDGSVSIPSHHGGDRTAGEKAFMNSNDARLIKTVATWREECVSTVRVQAAQSLRGDIDLLASVLQVCYL